MARYERIEPADEAEEAAKRARAWNRAPRREIQVCLRYRLTGREKWCSGKTVNISESGVLFSSNELLEVNDKLEITFQTTGTPLLPSSTRQASVVRRVLSNWPEIRVLFGARFNA